MALKVGEYTDNVWEIVPDNGTANVRLAFRLNGRSFAGKLTLVSEFVFRAIDKETQQMANVGLNPNLNGRWLFEGLAPGTYDMAVIGSRRFAGWEWRKEGVVIDANSAPVFELDLVPAAND